MFRDTQEELDRLNAELKAQQEADRQAEAEDMIDALLEEDEQIGELEDGVYKNADNNYGSDLRNFASDYQAYNSDHTDVDPEELSEMLEETEKVPSLKGLTITAILLTLGIVAVVVFLIWYVTSAGVKW